MGIDCLKNEIALTPYIATKVHFPFSYPQYIGKETEIYPAPFAGYKMVHGKPLSDTEPKLIDDFNFAKTLALLLKELHSVPVQNHEIKLQGDQAWHYNLEQRLEKTKERILQYKPYFIDAGFDVDELFKTIEKISKFNVDNLTKTSYVHGDIYGSHLLVDNNMNLSGIIDWGDVHIGNPGIDLSVTFMILSDTALKVFFDTYGPIDNSTKNIALLRAFCHPIALLPYCYENNLSNLKEWGILALRNSINFITRGV